MKSILENEYQINLFRDTKNSDEANTILSNIDRTRTSFFEHRNELEHVHLLMIELEHPILGFERSNIEIRTLFDPSLIKKELFWIVF